MWPGGGESELVWLCHLYINDYTIHKQIDHIHGISYRAD